MAQFLHPGITILIALTPAALALWWGRSITRHLDDPLLPERLFALRKRTGPAFGVGIGLLLALARDHCIWAIPLLVLARMAAAYPIRKKLYQETWSPGAYLSFFFRLLVAVFGPWLLLAMLPFASFAPGIRGVMLAAGLAAIVIAWHTRHSAMFRWMLRARPVDDVEVAARFGRLLQQCGLRPVTLDQVDLHGGMFANAVALPSIRWPGVVLTDTLLMRMDRDETVAILAHELAHLEWYNPARLRRNNAILYVLAVAGALWFPALRYFAPQTPATSTLLWPVVLLAVGLLRVQHRQKHETESDLRAVELTGDPDALIRALTKLHAFALLPRRWDNEFERRATHPSLARRIQAIRAAGETKAAGFDQPAGFSSPGGAASATFHDTHLEWRQGAAAPRTIEYSHLSELRIQTLPFGDPRLVAIDSNQQRSEMALQSGDVARLQSVLDLVDHRFAKVATSSAMPFSVRRILSLLAIAAAMAAGQTSVLIAGLLELLRSGPQMAAACGASAVTAAVLTWRDGQGLGGEAPPLWVVLTLLVAGVALLAAAFATRTEAPARGTRKLVIVLALLSLLIWVLLPLHGMDPLELHRSALEWPSASVLTLGLAGALAFSPSAGARRMAAPAVLAGVFAAFLGTDLFVGRFVTDPFVAQAPKIDVLTLSASPSAEASVDFDASDLWISNTGRYVALSKDDDDERTTIHVGRLGGALTEFSADAAAFLDETRLFLVKRHRGGSDLRLIDLSDGNREIWSIRTNVAWPALSIDRRSERWRLLGWNSDDDFQSAEGTVGDSHIVQRSWKASPDEIDQQEVVAVSKDVALVVEEQPLPGSSLPFLRTLRYLDRDSQSESRLWAVKDGRRVEVARSRIDLSCAASDTLDHPAICSSFDGAKTRFFAMNPAGLDTQRLAPLSAAPGRVYFYGHHDRGWLVGWWTRGLTAFEPESRRAIRLMPLDGDIPDHLAVGETVLGSLTSSGRRSTIRVYSMPTH